MRWLFSVFFGSSHPRHRSSLRWRIAQYTALRLVFGGLALLLSLALAMALIYIVSEQPGPGLPHSGRRFRPLWLMLDTLRLLLGAGDFSGQADNLTHQVLGTFGAIIGALFPALVIGIAFVRLFTMRIFEWRSHINACLAAELDDDLRIAIADPSHAFLAVRWYKRVNNLALANLRAEAYLRVRTVSEHDGSTFYRYQLLKVLNLSGNPASSCVWPETFSGMPFTLWIPLEHGLVDGQVEMIQGRRLSGNDRHLVVRLTGSISVGPASHISEERRYHLSNDVQVGRFVPVDPDLDTPARIWPGWRDFERQVSHQLFLYAELTSPAELRRILGREPLPGEVRRATLHHWAVGWRVCSDNTDPLRRHTFFTPGTDAPDPIQVLYPTVLPQPGATAEGLVLEVTPQQLARLDLREGVYARRRVNDDVTLAGGRSEISGVVWIYVGHVHLVERADVGLSQGTARIDNGFLAELQAAYQAHPGLADAFSKIPLPRLVPIIELERRSVEPPGQ